ncbi:nicotinamidase/pyrazinamidase [Marinitoga hydrogenitolerans DSM 16785]|uniref:nicotinamidase n=1 Tax=Marinitoga hydrogenitolerans (strain DSM 16785 / JCM 12826 / AT1271) TaxID=1122195 RepID=A0A1M4XKI9_MARH1|nr:isochorismatase family protein [Marinitoga hydrogenitolerans]SHE93931.1 nicotinamidase/pyrazinamidase [Marinitoga hydrogenitolerans DSM 16785]
MDIIEKLKKLGYNPEDTAILCVDCQNGFTLRCSDELPVKGTTEEWINSVNDFLNYAKKNKYKIIASKDDHPKKHISFKIWPPHCVKNTFGNELFISHYDFLIKKGTTENTDSYSAFYEDFNSKAPTELENYLRKNNIKNLAVLGLAGDVCVLETIKTALEKKFNIIVLENYIKSVNEKNMKEILEIEKLNDEVKII